jgi:hypothetical protein
MRLTNPLISVHLSSEAEAIILEGTAEPVTDPLHPLAAPSLDAAREKYPAVLRPEVAVPTVLGAPPFTAFATLEGFPRGATRWRF